MLFHAEACIWGQTSQVVEQQMFLRAVRQTSFLRMLHCIKCTAKLQDPQLGEKACRDDRQGPHLGRLQLQRSAPGMQVKC